MNHTLKSLGITVDPKFLDALSPEGCEYLRKILGTLAPIKGRCIRSLAMREFVKSLRPVVITIQA